MSRKLSRELSMNSSGSLPSNVKESRIPKPVFTRRTSLADSSAKSTESDTQKRTVMRPSHTSLETKASSAGGRSSQSGTESDKVQVTIRLRPLSDREKTRGDQEVWRAVDKQTIGISIGSESKTKYAFDQVFDAQANNKQLYEWSAKRIVGTSMDGLNATVFVYGVTSSGKTHTMMGAPSDPGIVQRAIRDVFRAIEETPDRDFLLRLSMMEIYNEVINDLLDPTRGQLKLREDPSKGFFVEGIKEETLVSTEHALSLIAAGDANRKVSATAYNEDSSRSHTIMRLSIESSERPGPEHDPRIHVARTLSFLNLIDLAGSESAKQSEQVPIGSGKGLSVVLIQIGETARHKADQATLTKNHTKEGSYINKSLLTLGTVIAKLSDGHAVHVPFRDSKLTRLLQSSMTGSGARVSVIATITPASCQAEETHNTLKFATRAKKIEIHAQRNEILDQSSLILRYQAEIRQLRAQLEEAAKGRGVALTVDPLHPEVRNLRERLEEEHQALLQREQDKASLEMRIARLTRIILSSTRLTRADSALGWRYRQMLRSDPQGGQSMSNGSEAMLDSQEYEDQGTNGMTVHTPTALWRERAGWEADADMASTIASIRSAGDIFPGYGLLKKRQSQPEESGASREIDILREQISVLAEELDSREWQGSDDRSNDEANEALEVDLQIMSAERDFLEAKLKRGRSQQDVLVAGLQTLRRQLLDSGIRPKLPQLRLRDVDELSCSDDASEMIEDHFPARDEEAQQMRRSVDSNQASGFLTNIPEERAKFLADIEALKSDVNAMKVCSDEQEAKLSHARQKLQQVTEREKRVEDSLRATSKEAKQLRSELQRLEVVHNNLQGYGLDEMSGSQITQLISSAQQAIERMHLSLQIRQMEAERQREAQAAAAAAQERARRQERAMREQQALRDAQKPQGGQNPIGPYQPMRIALNRL